MMYKKPFHITDNTSNNAFSFERRNNPSIYVPSIIEGKVDDVQIGDEIVFEDFDENGELKSCVGLKHFIHMTHPKTGKPIVIVDNHNHVFYFWYEARSKGLILDNATLIHIDQHKDTREPSQYLSKTDTEDLQKVFEYTNTVLNVGNYIPPAVADGLIEKVISIMSEGSLTPEGGQSIARLRDVTSVILNIDLDFWSPEMDYIDNELKTARTKELMKSADLITIATSPFFIDQERALKVISCLGV